MSRIVFLGSGRGYDAIRKGRCSGGILIQSDTQILINPGIGSVLRSCEYNLDISKTTIALISSDNLEHNSDLEFIKKICNPTIINNSGKHNERKNFSSIDIIPLNFKDKTSFIIHTPKYIISYIEDFNKSMIKELTDSNIIISDFNNDIEEMLYNLNPELLILTNFSGSIDPLDFVRDLKKKFKENINSKTQILPAKDGMIINPESYNIRLKQKKLKFF